MTESPTHPSDKVALAWTHGPAIIAAAVTVAGFLFSMWQFRVQSQTQVQQFQASASAQAQQFQNSSAAQASTLFTTIREEGARQHKNVGSDAEAAVLAGATQGVWGRQ
jgi:uncharacterized protein HemX